MMAAQSVPGRARGDVSTHSADPMRILTRRCR
jgi:hypothetical protein